MNNDKYITAFLGMGSNLESPGDKIISAVDCIKRLPMVRYVRGSSLYVTEPVEVTDAQPDYINMVCEIKCSCSPFTLLGMCLGIEAAFKRERPFDKAARTLDIDLLLCFDENGMISMDTIELMLPHPRMFNRAFVLVPLAELYPEKRVYGVDISSALGRCKNQNIHLL